MNYMLPIEYVSYYNEFEPKPRRDKWWWTLKRAPRQMRNQI